MSIINWISLFGGLGLFLFGMTYLGAGLERFAGGRFEKTLERFTGNVFSGIFLGALVSGVIQSSSATTVIVVGFVNSGMMKLTQAVGIIMGANIGTTVTSQILAMGDISSDLLILKLLKPSVLSSIIVVSGLLLSLVGKSERRKNLGQTLLGLGILFFGMNAMETALMPLRSSPDLSGLFTRFSNPLLGVVVGAAVTAIVQSSSASVGILQALSSTGAIPFSAAAPIIMGQNIGTCVTALLSGVRASKNARRAAFIHLYFNIIGTAVFLIGLYSINAFFRLPFWDSIETRSSIANFHLLFNVSSVIILLPFNKMLVRLVTLTIPDSEKDESELNILDERFLSTPSVALDMCRLATVQMAKYGQENYQSAVSLMSEYNPKALDKLQEIENRLDQMEGQIGNYLVRLTDRSLHTEESQLVSEMLKAVSDFERIGDYAINLTDAASAMYEKQLIFSQEALNELKIITDAVSEIISKTVNCFEKSDYDAAMSVEPLEQVIDLMRDFLRNKHIERLKNGTCTIDNGTHFLEMLINLERISDHCSNIAIYIIQRREVSRNPNAHGIIDPHEYLRTMHRGESEEYQRDYEKYKAKYYTPLM